MRAARLAVVAAVASVLTGCSSPAAEDSSTAATSSTASASGSSDPPAPTPSPAESSTPERQSGARAQVPDRVILRQLRDAAERIAKRMPTETPVPTPADVEPETNRALGYQLMLDFGYAADQWPYLDALWHRESGWNHLAENKSSGAYGIPQSLPAEKMAVVGSDWRTNPVTQIRWGLAYISARYRNPERAWAHSERHGWY